MQKNRRAFIHMMSLCGAGLVLPRSRFSPFSDFASIEINMNEKTSTIHPNIYGQFVEHLGRCIDGGIYEPGSPLADKAGYRTDVLKKIQALNTPLIRFPGGTYTKIYHWMDGIGPISQRHARPNLIWGGVNNNHFGTDEMLHYAQRINADAYFAVNMSTGTAEEASNWVEYCNGSRNTYYADMRRKNGHAAPYNVKYWGLGNEELAQGDAGRLQNPDDFVKEAWMYAKLMKLQDPEIKFILSGADSKWNEQILKNLHPIANYISLHSYSNTEAGKPASLFAKTDHLESEIIDLQQQIDKFAPEQVTGFDKWYRFPPRTSPVKIAIDELGIWEKGEGVYGLECKYNWNQALGTATLYNIMQRQAASVTLANWAQTVNVLAPIMTNKQHSICQTVYYPMQFYRQLSGNESIPVQWNSPNLQLPGAEEKKSLDVSATRNDKDGSLVLFVINRHPNQTIKSSLQFSGDAKFTQLSIHELNAASIEASNGLGQPNTNVVTHNVKTIPVNTASYDFPPHSITAFQYK